MRNPPGLVTALVALATLVLAGCAAPPKTTTSPTVPAQSGTIEVAMNDNLKFDPMEVTIAAGSTVRWKNVGAMDHDVTGEGKAWQSPGGSGGVKANGTFEKMFDAKGTFKYYCTLHSGGPGGGMWGTVSVV